MAYRLTRKTLARLLQEAKKAHGVYEKKLGFPDAKWPEWYADYILKKISK